ncbi:MAG: hypothetical protein WC310_02220 [Patescibacteria group bacterium]
MRIIPEFDDPNYCGWVGACTCFRRLPHSRWHQNPRAVLVSERKFEPLRVQQRRRKMPAFETEDITETDPSAAGKSSPILAPRERRLNSV